MKPCFFSLFKRGRYLSAPDDGDDTDEAKKQRKERERFAVAVLAFCLRHDEGFRKHFWERVCRVPEDPEPMPPITPDGIAIEPPHWADLRLISDDKKCRYMWVVEAKAGAPLEPRQNPRLREEFEKPGHGYGALFADAEEKRGTKMRYIVLGAIVLRANDPLGFRRILCWLWRQRDSRQLNPFSGQRSDAPVEHEKDFFRGWRLMEVIARAAKQRGLETEDFVRSLRFDNLADNCPVFAFPKSIRTRSEASRLTKWLFKQLTAGLPPRESESLLGSPQEWDILLTYEDRRRQGNEHLPALRYTFDTLFLKLPAVRKTAAKPTERTLDAVLQHNVAKKMLAESESTRWHSWLADFARINSPSTNAGLIQLVFPRLEVALALPPKRQQARLKR